MGCRSAHRLFSEAVPAKCFILYTFFAIQEIFGPVLTVYVYPEKRYKEVLELIDTTTPYGLTGALFAQEK